MAPLRRYNPSAELLDWASESYSINALDERVLGEFIDWHIEHDNLRIRFEYLTSAIVLRRSLAEERHGKESEAQEN